MALSAQQFGERLTELRAQAKSREDPLILGILDLLHQMFLEPVPAAPAAPAGGAKPTAGKLGGKKPAGR